MTFVRKLSALIAALLLFTTAFAAPVYITPPSSQADDDTETYGDIALENISRIFSVELNTDTILIGQKENEKFCPPSAMAVLMNAYIALTELDPSEIYTIPVEVPSLSGSRKAGIRTGNKIFIKDLAASVILNGAQDSALALAFAVSGSPSAFVDKLNQYAATLNMTNTVFASADGSPEGQSTTCADLALLSRALLELPAAFEIISSFSYAVFTTASALPSMLYCDLDLFDDRTNNYSEYTTGALGVGTGSNGTCLSFVADAGDMKILTVMTSDEDEQTATAAAGTLPDSIVQTFDMIDITDDALLLLSDIETEGCSVRPDLDQLLIISEKTWCYTPDALSFEVVNAVPPVLDAKYADASVSINGTVVKQVPLICTYVEPEPEPTPVPTPEPTPGPTARPSLYRRAGWIFWITGSAVFCAAGLVILSLIKKRRSVSD